MEFLVLIFVHIFFGIIWAGSAIATGLFIVPSVVDAGPAGGVVMTGVARRKFPTVMMVTAALVVLSGLRLYMLRFSSTWVTTPEGLVLTLGGLLALAAFVMGLFVQKPTAERLSRLAAEIARAGSPPSASQASELQALRARLRKSAAVTAWHLLAAAALMSAHRLAVAF